MTKSGTNSSKVRFGTTGRRDRFNQNDYFRKVNSQPKPLYRVNIPAILGGPVVIPGLMDTRKAPGRLSSSCPRIYADASPTTTLRANMPTAAERAGDFSQTLITNGTIQPIIDPQTLLAFPGNIIPARPHQSTGPGHAQPAAAAEWHPEPAIRAAVHLELGIRYDARARPAEQRPRLDQVY